MKKATLFTLLLGLFPCWAYAQNPGDFLISEFMANPEHVPDAEGEYIELYNTQPYPVSLQGCTLQDGSGLYVTIDQSLWVPGYQLAVIGGSATPGATFYYPSSPPPFSLNNIGGDQISLICNGVVVAQTVYTQTQAAGQSRELITTLGHPTGFTAESDYRDTDNAFQYVGASSSENGSPTLPGEMFVLPVELSQFEAKPKSDAIILQWTTQTELNNNHFDIEHSTNGRHFKRIGQVEGYGNSQTPRHYQFRHRVYNHGLHYYRLVQHDYDGTYTYSGIVSARFGTMPQLQAYPTRTAGPLHLRWQFPAPAGSQVNIYSIHGRLLRSFNIQAGSNSTAFDLKSLRPGAYIAQFKAPRTKSSIRFFKY